MKLKGRKKLERGQPGAAGVGDTRGATDTDTAASLVSVHSWCGPAPQLAAITAGVCAFSSLNCWARHSWANNIWPLAPTAIASCSNYPHVVVDSSSSIAPFGTQESRRDPHTKWPRTQQESNCLPVTRISHCRRSSSQ